MTTFLKSECGPVAVHLQKNKLVFKNYLTYSAKYMMCLFFIIIYTYIYNYKARESSKFILKIRMTLRLFAVQKISRHFSKNMAQALPYPIFFHDIQNAYRFNKHNCEETMTIHPPPCGISATRNIYPSYHISKVLRG